MTAIVTHQGLRALREAPDTNAESAAPDEAGLVARVSRGDSRALEQLYDRYGRVVYSMALRMLGRDELAEDVVQEVFWRVWRRSVTFQVERGQVGHWILGIAHNLCIDELRRMRVRPQAVYETDESPVLTTLVDEQTDVHASAWERAQRETIVLALRQLPPEQREAIELAYFGGLSQREIAERLDNPLGTIKTRVRLGLQKLRDILSMQGLGLE